MKKILITGHRGFIGKRLVKILSQKKYELIFFEGDVTKKQDWKKYNRFNLLIHLAANVNIKKSWTFPKNTILNNVSSSMFAVENCIENDAHLIFLSSYLYGNTKLLPTPENHRIISLNPYALSKEINEKYLKFCEKEFDLKLTILRPFNIYGPGQSPTSTIPELINQAFENDFIKVENLDTYRDYLYVDDLVSVLNKIIILNKPGNIFNVGSSNSYSIKNIIELIQKITRKKIKILNQNIKRKNHIKKTQACIKHLQNNIRWEPSFSLEKGLKETIKYIKKEKLRAYK